MTAIDTTPTLDQLVGQLVEIYCPKPRVLIDCILKKKERSEDEMFFMGQIQEAECGIGPLRGKRCRKDLPTHPELFAGSEMGHHAQGPPLVWAPFTFMEEICYGRPHEN